VKFSNMGLYEPDFRLVTSAKVVRSTLNDDVEVD
jgi:hypothetical protein